MFCPGCKKMAWDVLSRDVLSYIRDFIYPFSHNLVHGCRTAYIGGFSCSSEKEYPKLTLLSNS